MQKPFPGTSRIAFFLVLLLGMSLGTGFAQVDTDTGCGAFLGSDTACGDGSRNPRPQQPGAPQPAPPIAPSAGTWDEYDFTKPAQTWQGMNQPGAGRFGQMPPSLGGDIASTTGGTGMMRAQASGGNPGGMTGWLAVLTAFMGLAAIAAGS